MYGLRLRLSTREGARNVFTMRRGSMIERLIAQRTGGILLNDTLFAVGTVMQVSWTIQGQPVPRARMHEIRILD